MSLTPGTRLGVYEVTVQIGEGGMGQVYRARDMKLNRDVALKILSDAFASDPDRLARFTREAQTLASLNHPNIAAIYGIEESQDVRALVMELVEGEDLADRIVRGPIPMDEALPIAKQIAEALEAAHDQGIIHRDLKPANIKVRPDGTVKVLDFGLAKAMEPAGVAANVSQSPTLTTPAMTQAGVILGTAAYMSPEQAKGRVVDKRSDVWAFGCVLFEILTGKRAFAGEDVSDTLAEVLKGEPDWTALPTAAPPSIRALVEGCLRKDRKQRIGDISTALYLLNQRSATSGAAPTVVGPPARPQPLWRRAIPVVLAATVAGALAGTVLWYRSLRPMTPLAVTRLPFMLPEGQAFSEPIARHMIALSADGAQIAYVANTRLYLRSMSELDVHAIQGTERYQYVTDPVFSPDGRSVAFYAAADQTLKKIATTGGAPVTICPAAGLLGMTWGPDGIVFGQRGKGIMRVSPNGGTPDVLVRVKDDEELDGPQLLPGGQHVLFTLATGTAPNRWDKARIVAQSVASGERKTLIEGGADARYVPTGHVVYAVGGSLFAVAFDLQHLEVRGGRVPLVEGVRRSSGSVTGAAHFSVSSTGSLIYIPGPVSSAPLAIAVIDRKGEVERLKLPPGSYLTPRASPDGTRIAFGTDDGKEAIVWIYLLSGRSTMQRLTFGGNNRVPLWSSDGKRVAFQSDREGDLAIFWQSAAGGAAERLTKPEQGESHTPESWSPKGDRLLFSVKKGSDVSLWTFSLRDRKATPFGDVHSSFPVGARFSPDGRWVAYASTERGTTAIYVQPFPTTGDKYQLSAKGLQNPHELAWSPDGKELFYVPRIGGFEAVGVTTEPTFAFGTAVAVPRPFLLGPPNSPTLYDIAPDGKFVGLITAGQTESDAAKVPQIQVVLNWFEELKARVPVP